MYVCVYVCVHVCVHVGMHVCMHACMVSGSSCSRGGHAVVATNNLPAMQHPGAHAVLCIHFLSIYDTYIYIYILHVYIYIPYTETCSQLQLRVNITHKNGHI